MIKILNDVGQSGGSNDGAIQASIDEHKNNKSNPHEVSKVDVGLENVDNTSDANKPISAATQNALGEKADKTELHIHSNKTILDGTTSSFTVELKAELDRLNDIQDNLTSDDTDKAGSAKQLKVLKGMIDNINTLLLSDDATLDELQEIVDFIKQNKDTLDTLGIGNIAGLQDALDGKANTAHTHSLDDISETGTKKIFTSDERTKLDGLENYDDTAIDTKIDNHIGNKINPHEVNKDQLGLNNVDNTSDANKPISNATQIALNGKENISNKVNFVDHINPSSTKYVSEDGIDDMYNSLMEYSNRLSIASKGCININPMFIMDDLDYSGYINGTTRKLVEDNVHGTSKALEITGRGSTLIGTEKFVVPSGYSYRAVVETKALLANGVSSTDTVLFYVGLVCFDSDNKIIYPYNLPNDNSKYAILTQDLNPNDTTITFKTNDIGNIVGSDVFPNGSDYTKYILGYEKQPNGEYCYIGANGRIYDNLLYSNNYMNSVAYDDDSIVDNGDDTYTLTLKTGWSGSALKIDDVVLQSRAGGTYIYWLVNNFVADNKWHSESSVWRDFSETENFKDGDGTVRNGTAMVKLLLLPAYRKTQDGVTSNFDNDDKQWISSIRLEYKNITS